jgi:hypothetical protein
LKCILGRHKPDQENGSQARIGAYMIWFEIVDAEGMVKSFRKRVVVAEKF